MIQTEWHLESGQLSRQNIDISLIISYKQVQRTTTRSSSKTPGYICCCRGYTRMLYSNPVQCFKTMHKSKTFPIFLNDTEPSRPVTRSGWFIDTCINFLPDNIADLFESTRGYWNILLNPRFMWQYWKSNWRKNSFLKCPISLGSQAKPISCFFMKSCIIFRSSGNKKSSLWFLSTTAARSSVYLSPGVKSGGLGSKTGISFNGSPMIFLFTTNSSGIYVFTGLTFMATGLYFLAPKTFTSSKRRYSSSTLGKELGLGQCFLL